MIHGGGEGAVSKSDILEMSGSPRLGVLVAAVLTAVWVALTQRTGVTYHLFPLLIVASAVLTPKLLWETSMTARRAGIAAAGGLAVTAAGWLALVLLNAEPVTTFVHRQPGGVPAEVAVLAIVGAGASIWWASRR